MRVIARRTLREFWERHSAAELPLRAWCKEVEAASWKSPTEVKARYASASFLTGNRVVFNIKGNRFRLIAAVRYDLGIVFIRFVGTHAEYDAIDAAII